MFSYSRSLKSVLLGSSLLMSAQAFAQETPPPAEPEQTVADPSAATAAEIIVTGTRASLGRALDTKRNTLGIVDSISAEGIGKFPDRNVAESLQRVPGVSIDRQAGEGRFITVRGFGPQFNTVLINGRLLATDNAGREFSFDILPSELISGADVYKSSAANFQEGGIGSTVNVRTARPTDRSGLVIAGQIAGKYDSGSKDVTPTGSLLVSKSNADRSFGVLASLVYDKRNAVLKRYSTDGWLVHQNLDYDKDGTVDLADVAVPRTSGQLNDRNSRERIGGTLALDWVMSDTLRLQLDGLYTQYKIRSLVNQLGFFTDPADIINASINENRTVTQFVRGDTGSLATDNIVSGAPRDARTYQLAGNLKWTPGERDEIALDLSYSKATNDGAGKTPFYVLGTRNTGLNPTFDLRPDQPTPAYTNIVSPTDASDLRGHFGLQSGQDVKDEIYQARLDGSHEFDGIFSKLNYGGMLSQRTKTIVDVSTPQGILCFYCGYFATVPAITSVFNSGNFLGSAGLPTSWLTFDPKQLVDYYASDAAIGQQGDPAAEAAFRDLIRANGNSYAGILNPAASGRVRERSAALYLQGEFKGDLGGMDWTASAGVRWVYTSLLSTGSAQQISSITTLPGDATQVNYTLTDPLPVSIRNHYSYFLPSATFKLNLTEKLALRLSGSRTLTRPTLTQLAPTQSYSLRPPATFYSSGGNPALKPFLAWNADAGLDYYFDRASYVAVAGFYKKISNFVVNVTTPVDILGYTFLDTRPTNQKSSEVYGVEATAQATLTFLPAPFDGLGGALNYTKVYSSSGFDPSLSDQTFNVEGLSDSANIVLFYEKGPVQVRGAYNWRQGFLRATFGAQGEPENVSSYGQYDASVSFKLTPEISIFGDVQNITNAKLRAYSRYQERILSLEDSGRRITAGVRASF